MNAPPVFVAGQDILLRGLIASVLRLDDHRAVEVAGLAELIDGVERAACAGDRDFAIVADAETGLDMLRTLRAADWRTPVIIFTGSDRDAHQACGARATMVLRGAFTMARLRAAVRKVTARQQDGDRAGTAPRGRTDLRERRLGRHLRLLLAAKGRAAAGPRRRPTTQPRPPCGAPSIFATCAVGGR
jgi:DNA-binding NtrC family response regulator